MAGIKIVDLPALGRDLLSTDLLEMSIGGTASRKITGQEIMNASKLNVGATPIVSGTVGRLLFQGTGNVLQQSSSLFWDSTNNRLGIGTETPTSALDLFGSIGLGSASSVGLNAVSGRITFKNGANNTRIESVQIDGTFPQNQRLDFYPHTSNAAAFQIGFNNITSVLNHNFSANALLTALSSVTFAHSSGVSEGIRFDATTKRIRLNSFYVSIEGNTNEVFQATDGTNVLMRLRGNGNLLLNTTTDAGFRLDVNGTARINTLTIGLGAGQVSTNTALGNVALNANTTGASNTAVGYFAMNNNRGGTNNTAVGLQSLLDNQNGNANTAIGRNALLNTSGSNNTAIGFQAGSVGVPNTTGENNIFIGYQATGVSASQSNRTWIGNSSTTSTWLAGNVLINTTTDAGFRLDVNGTARVSGNFNIATGFELNFNNANVGIYRSANSLRLGGYGGIEFLSSPTTIASQTVRMVLFDTGNLCIGNTLDVASARLIVNSTTQGFLPPRMTNAQRTAIVSPAVGLIVYCTDVTEGLWVYKSTGWTFIV
jgi:hypothetical protein